MRCPWHHACFSLGTGKALCAPAFDPVAGGRGVAFHLGEEVARIAPTQVALKGGAVLQADLVVLGTGARPRAALAEAAGLAAEDGVLVDGWLETGAPGIYAAGGVARWPDPHSGERIRVEHWVAAERVGQVVALDILGRRERLDAMPFFWSRHYHGLNIDYRGHAARWDEIAVEGALAAKRAVLHYRRDGRVLAAATVDRECLRLKTAVEAGEGAA